MFVSFGVIGFVLVIGLGWVVNQVVLLKLVMLRVRMDRIRLCWFMFVCFLMKGLIVF